MSEPVPQRKIIDGPYCRDFVRAVARRKAARNYLEIGVQHGSTIALVDAPTIGVDPNFLFNRDPMGRKRVMHLYQITSDEFFRDHDPTRIFGSPVDLAFLDGLHLFEFLLRDFINTERHCAPDALILLDDCLPPALEMTEREHRRDLRKDKETAGWWTGDVWKVVEILRAYRPDLVLTPVNVNLAGCIVVSNLDPASTRLTDCYDEILGRYSGVEMDASGFEAYWQANAPMPADAALRELARYWRA